ncbi:MAG: Smr/MutS family protein [Bacteroidetes bacterium]|nr:Smr/MutS family protein [Bacteroidota bacterium]
MRCLESAIENHYNKIYFIHGIGNGTLKAKVQDYLKDYNESLEYRDAPYDKYGTGAVEVVIRENL